LLKVDVEGAESLVFEGARQSLEMRLPKMIVYEVCPTMANRLGIGADVASRHLESHGYRLLRVKNGSLEPVTSADAKSESLANWIAMPS
jgi:hypothetical protein